MDSSAWDDRYAGADLVWSAAPNVWVQEWVEHLDPGLALDVAAGEGRNAIWLVEGGWTVTATDYSPVAVSRMHQIADDRLGDLRTRLTAEVADATAAQPAPHEAVATGYDLVLFCYLHLPHDEWALAIAAGVAAAAPGGLVLVVAHALRNLTEGFGGPQDASVLLDPRGCSTRWRGCPWRCCPPRSASERSMGRSERPWTPWSRCAESLTRYPMGYAGDVLMT